MKTVKGLLEWIPTSEGGRKQAFEGMSYSTVAKFDSQGDDWKKNAWSVVIGFAEPRHTTGKIEVTVRFLVEDAPHDWLKVGKKMTLYEGKSPTCWVEITDETFQPEDATLTQTKLRA